MTGLEQAYNVLKQYIAGREVAPWLINDVWPCYALDALGGLGSTWDLHKHPTSYYVPQTVDLPNAAPETQWTKTH